GTPSRACGVSELRRGHSEWDRRQAWPITTQRRRLAQRRGALLAGIAFLGRLPVDAGLARRPSYKQTTEHVRAVWLRTAGRNDQGRGAPPDRAMCPLSPE